MRPLLLGMEWFIDRPEGLNRYFYELFRALTEQGVEARAVVLGPMSDPAKGAVDAGPVGASLPLRLWRYARAVGPAAVDANVVDAHFALYAALSTRFGRVRGLPLVVHFQGPWAEESWAAGERSALKLRAKRLLERSVYRRARIVVVLSGEFKRILVERYGVRPWNVVVVPPGVDLRRFSPAPPAEARAALGIDPTRPIALTVRRLVARTGVDVLLEAWSRLDLATEPVLLVAGDGAARPDLERLARELGVSERVRFLGRVSDDTLLTCYRAADLCVVPSVALEGFGLVVLEALACGTPVIATDTGGLPEALSGLDPNLIVRAGDPEALATRMRGALREPSSLPSGDRCRQYAQRFSWRDVAAQHVELYERARTPPRRKKLRVVYIDHCARLSGGEIALVRLLSALQDVEAHVILGDDGPLVSRLLRAGISVEVIPLAEGARDLPRESIRPTASSALAAIRSAGYAIRLARRLAQLEPDLVHTNSLKAAFYGGTAARLARVPVVWHVRDRIADDYLPRGAVRLVRSLSRLLPDAVIAVSRASLATLGDATGVVVCDPVRAPDGGDRRDAGPLRVGMVGRIAPWKGQHVFLEAFARAFPRGSEQAVVVGAPLFGEERYEHDLRDLSLRLGLDGRIDFRGFRDDVWQELSRFDVLVHASVIPEPGGQVVLEGMAVGMPVVASAAGGPAEVLENGVTGLLCSPGDVDALAQALRTLAADVALRERLGRAAQERAQAFAPEVVAKSVMDVYRQVLAQP